VGLRGLLSRSQLGGIFGIVLLFGVVATSHYLAHKQPCPASTEELNREILIASPAASSASGAELKLDAYIHNESKRALTRVVVEANLSGSGRIQAEAINNEPGAPSLSDAPILPGAWRAVRFDFAKSSSADVVPPLQVLRCSCD